MKSLSLVACLLPWIASGLHAGDDPAARAVEVQKLIGEGRYAEARRKADDLVRDHPGDARAILARGSARLWTNDTRGALQDVSWAAQREPNNGSIAWFAASLELMTGDPRKALAASEEVLRRWPKSAKSLELRGQAALWNGDTKGAVQYFQQVVAAEPAGAKTLYEEAGRFLGAGVPQAAAMEYTTVVWLDPHCAGAYYGLGVADSQLGLRDRAVEAFKRFLQSDQTSEFAQRARQEIARLGAAAPGPTPPAKTGAGAASGDPEEELRTAGWTVQSRSEGSITRAAGGTISLTDGSRVEVPAGALDADRKIEVRKYASEGPSGRCQAYYVIGSDDVALRSEARLTFPFPDTRAGCTEKDARVMVCAQRRGQPFVEVPAEVDWKAHTVSVRTRHFSRWVIVAGMPFPFSDSWLAERRGMTPEAILDVPYYWQDGADWCWAATTSMMLKYHGKGEQIWEVAATGERPFTDKGFFESAGLSLFNVLCQQHRAFFSPLGLSTSYCTWWDIDNLTDYIVDSLQQRRPVWVMLATLQHVVIVTGCDSTGIYVNDPSGVLLDKVGIAVADSHLNMAHIPWLQWYNGMTKWVRPHLDTSGFLNFATAGAGNPLFRNLAPIASMTVDGAPSTAASITATVAPDGIVFTGPPWSKTVARPSMKFKWVGVKLPGCRFETDMPIFFGGPDCNPTNSDALTKFEVLLSNSASADNPSCDVQLCLDGKALRSARATVPGRTSNSALDLMGKDQGGACDFSSNVLTPGPHQFSVAVSKDGRLLDQLAIPFVMGPSKPTGLAARSEGGAVHLTWNPVPEAAQGCRISYRVWCDNIGEGAQPLATVAETTWQQPRAAGDTGKHRYYVQAVVAASPEVHSVLSDKVEPEAAGWVGKWSGTATCVESIRTDASGSQTLPNHNSTRVSFWIVEDAEHGFKEEGFNSALDSSFKVAGNTLTLHVTRTDDVFLMTLTRDGDQLEGDEVYEATKDGTKYHQKTHYKLRRE